MADYRLNLTSGPTSVDLYAGSYSKLMEAGLLLPVPKSDVTRVASPFADGDRLAGVRYANRVITANLKLSGSSLSDLKTNIRTIQRLLNDAAGYSRATYLKKYVNLLTNASFETGDPPDDWTAVRSVLAHVTTPVKHGTYAMEMTADSGGSTTAHAYQNYAGYAAYAGLPVTLGAWVRCPATNDKTQSLGINDGVGLTQSSNIAKDGVWHWASVTRTINAGASMLWSTFRASETADTDDILYVDGAILTPGSYAPPTGTPLSTGKLYLELQWGDLDGQSIYFEVVRGDLQVPDDLYSTNLSKNYLMYPARLELEAKPFGEFMQLDLAQDTLENAVTNYKDVATAEAHGDVPAKALIKIAQTGATGSKKLWIAKRSGHRYADDLWTEGEDNDSWTLVASLGAYYTVTESTQADAACSAGNTDRLRFIYNGSFNEQIIGYLTYSMAPPPRGTYRVLIRAKADGDAYTTYDMMGFGLGYAYGVNTKTPSEANGDYKYCAADNTYQILDLGLVSIPPTAESDIAGNGAFDLRLYIYQNGNRPTMGGTVGWYVDYVFLVPIDEGLCILTDVADTDIIALDGVSEEGGAFLLDSDGNIAGYPTYEGAPFAIGRETTRIYVLRDDVPAVTFTLDIKYVPRFLTV